MTSHTRVLVAGGGVAALETCMALGALAGDRVLVTLIAPNAFFEYRPVGVHDPLAVRGRVRVPTARLARDAGADVLRDRLADIDPVARRVRTGSGCELAYDALVLATGARPGDAPAGAVPFDATHVGDCEAVVRAVNRRRVRSLAFVEPPAPTQSLDLYDLALETADAARRDGAAPALTLVTAQPGPLAFAGAGVVDMMRMTLASHGIRVVESAYVRSIADRELELVPGSRRVVADRIIAAPRLAGPRPLNLPCDADGFLPVDPFGRLPGVDGVYAAGDCAAYPVKHPSLAAQQADAVATAIAGEPEPFTPVLRCMLPSRLRWYIEAPLTGGLGDAAVVSAHPLWPGDARFVARHLSAGLADFEHCERRDRGEDRRDDERVDDGHRAAAAIAAH
jgi:sulfide:quinone oxidoreductase